jgi:hypothetical protein
MTIDTSLTYKIRGRQSNKCLYSTDYQGQYDCSPDGDGQNFKLEDRGDGYYRIKGVQSNKCLYSNQHGVGHWDCNDADSQKFKLEKAGSDGREYKIYAKETQKCIFANSDGRYGHYGCNDGDDMRFYFVPMEYNCCFANVERKGANTTYDNGWFKCDPKHTDPGGTACTNIYSNYCKVGGRIITDSKCKALANTNYTLFNELMGAKCDLDEFYKTTECFAWCKENSTKCNKLNTETSCKEFDIPTSECNVQKVLDLKTECQKYGLRSEQGLPIYKCSPAGVKAITDECKKYGISDTCTPTALQDAITNTIGAAQLEVSSDSLDQMRENADLTKQALEDMATPTTPATPATPATPGTPATPATPAVQNIFDLKNIQQWIKDNSTMFMIIIAVMVLIICSSSSVSALLL